jgi:hypothetical protein
MRASLSLKPKEIANKIRVALKDPEADEKSFRRQEEYSIKASFHFSVYLKELKKAGTRVWWYRI